MQEHDGPFELPDGVGGMLRLVRSGPRPVYTERPPMRGPGAVAAYLAPYCESLPVEVMGVLLLCAQHRLLGAPVEITRGLVNSSLVHPREVFRAAVVAGASAVILWHNHPSGDPTPSMEDRLVTDQLVAAGRLLDIPVHDHVIIGVQRYVSFAEAGLL